MATTHIPVLVPPIAGQRYHCHHCGNCCRDIAVHLTAEDRTRLDAQGWEEKLPMSPAVRLGQDWVLNQTPDRRCVFLQADDRCRIHLEHGGAAKPLACRMFPFVLLPERGHWQLSYRFDCPSLAASRGRPIAEQHAALQALAKELPDPPPAEMQPLLAVGRPAALLEAQALIRALDRWLQESDLTPQRRLHGLAHMAETLSTIRVDKVVGDRFVQLLEILFAGLDGELGAPTADWPAPTPRQLKILRQQVFVHCHAIAVTEALGKRRSLITEAIKQFVRRRHFTALHGSAPPSVVSDRAIPFAVIQSVQPARQHAEDVGQLLLRYLRAQILPRSFCGPSYYGWDMISGLHALVSRVAVWGWLARYCAAAADQREIDMNAAVRAIGLIARAAGVNPALGARSERLRLQYLRLEHGQQRLLHTFQLAAPH